MTARLTESSGGPAHTPNYLVLIRHMVGRLCNSAKWLEVSCVSSVSPVQWGPQIVEPGQAQHAKQSPLRCTVVQWPAKPACSNT